MAVAPADHAHELGGQDLAPARPVAQAGRLDHRHPEEVAALARDVAQRDADAHRQRLGCVAVAPLDPLLHRDCAGDRVGRAAEDDHQPVAGVLDLLARAGADRLAQQPEVLASRSSSAATGPRRAASPVEPTRSVMRTVTVSTVAMEL